MADGCRSVNYTINMSLIMAKTEEAGYRGGVNAQNGIMEKFTV